MMGALRAFICLISPISRMTLIIPFSVATPKHLGNVCESECVYLLGKCCGLFFKYICAFVWANTYQYSMYLQFLYQCKKLERDFQDIYVHVHLKVNMFPGRLHHNKIQTSHPYHVRRPYCLSTYIYIYIYMFPYIAVHVVFPCYPLCVIVCVCAVCVCFLTCQICPCCWSVGKSVS